MDKQNKDTLANLISCELQRMESFLCQAVAAEYKAGIEYWAKEVRGLKRLDNEIWKHL